MGLIFKVDAYHDACVCGLRAWWAAHGHVSGKACLDDRGVHKTRGFGTPFFFEWRELAGACRWVRH